MIVIVALAWVMIRYTVIGRQIIAAGGSEKAARLTGIPVKRVKLFVYMVSGALAGVAGLVVVARNSTNDANLVGLGWISLSAYWQSVIRGAFLLIVFVLRARLVERHHGT